MKQQYAVLDFETGGLSVTKSALVSVGVTILDSQFNTISDYYTIIQDSIFTDLNPKALLINKINRMQIKEDGVPIDVVLANLSINLHNRIVVCHNAPFDIAFLNRYNIMEVREAIDTMFLSWHTWPGKPAKLFKVCERLEIEVVDAHNALADTQMTAKMLEGFYKLYLNGNIKHNPLEPGPIDFNWMRKKTRGWGYR